MVVVRRTISVALLLLLVVTAAAVGLMVYFSAQLRESSDWVVHTYEVMEGARKVLSSAQDVEIGQRGYIVTEQTAYQAPYAVARTNLPTELAALKELVGDNPVQAARVAELDRQVKTLLDEAQTLIEIGRREGLAEARQRMQGSTDKNILGDIRRTVHDMVIEEETLLRRRVADAEEAHRHTIAVIISTAALATAALVYGFALLTRTDRRRRQVEADLAAQSVVLQATLDGAHDGIAAFDASGALVAYNQHFFTLMGFPANLAKRGAMLAGFLDVERDRPGRLFDNLPTLAEAAARTDHARQVFEITHGGRTLECYRGHMTDGGFLVSCADITRRKEAEAMARQAQKIEAIGHLTGGVAHDFNNLLQIIRANLDLLARDLQDDEKQSARLRSAIAGVARGARLTAQLLAFARRQPLRPRVINLGRVLANVTEPLRRTLGEQIEIEAIVAGGLWNTLADPNQIENAILNLCINARDAMPDGGKLTIEVANAFLDEAYARTHAEVNPGQYVMLAVSDTGTGMSRQVLERAFEPFFTTKSEGKGTGLGLSQVYGFVKQSGGHAKIYSELGHGTTVKIYLPMVRNLEEQPEPVDTTPIDGGRETVLVVEDDPGVRQAVAELLIDLGYTVLKAEHAESALATLRSGVKVDVLFTDVVMPGPIKTRDLTRRAQEIVPGLAILYTSGYTENSIIHSGRLDEDVVLLSKPYHRDELARRLRAALARAAKAKADKEPSGAPKWTVLLIEDDVMIRLATADMLRQLGHTVLEAGSADGALTHVDEQPSIDAIVLDLGLPGMSGEDLAKELRRRLPAVPVIYASGSPPAATGVDGAGPAGHFLQKPYDLAGLKSALEDAARSISAR